jgi:hypothetical protein
MHLLLHVYAILTQLSVLLLRPAFLVSTLALVTLNNVLAGALRVPALFPHHLIHLRDSFWKDFVLSATRLSVGCLPF